MTLVLAAVLFWSTLGVIGKTLYGLGAEPLFVVTFRVLFALECSCRGSEPAPGRPRIEAREVSCTT
ncbi:MAG: hypothetical protein Kow0097_09160 [Candidatus Bipolaricaulota bacterium]|nr:hypothetical protein [Candidatus Bipolaricaulota bacterium]